MPRNAEQREYARLYMRQWRARTRATRVGKPGPRKSAKSSKVQVKKNTYAGENAIKQPTRLNRSSASLDAQPTEHVNGTDDDISLVAVREDGNWKDVRNLQSQSADTLRQHNPLSIETARGSQAPRPMSFTMHLSNQMGTAQSQSRTHLHENQPNIDISKPSTRQRDEFANLAAQVQSQNRRLEALEQSTEDIQNTAQDIQNAVEDTQNAIEDIKSAVEDTQNTVEGIHAMLNEILHGE